ncbi:MAG TPA: isoleucine--tRNA ligase [Candidatus Saccharimonadales bacterium]|nr:isoleucine--tRNA ligase [Candidatus Saccharimonadales bacterium]
MEEPKKSNLANIEEEMLATWQKENTFEKSLQQRKGSEVFSFYDGPPFANGLPHFGHSLVTAIKDSLGRYKTMQGYYVERRNGWDCHGLPVEFAIEKQFGVSGKKQILELGLEKFNAACRESIFMYKGEWEDFFGRIGRWTDVKNAYATVDRDYTESVWWVMKQIHDKGLLYKGYKSMPYCPRCETPLSNFEVNEGYRDNVPDPSLFVKFKLVGEDASLLGWTTTPWSLPGNAAIAVNPNETYVYVDLKTESGSEILIVAKKRLNEVFKDEHDFEILKEVEADELIGKNYEPLFKLDKYAAGIPDFMYKVWPASFVSVEDGTGVLHVAPAFGEDDLSLGTEKVLDVLHTVDTAGKIVGGIGFDEVEGKFFKGADKAIIAHLTDRGMVFAAETKEHTYPFCYRCDSPLLYYAIDTWFIKVSEIKDQMLKTAESINWSPNHIKDGRFGKWLAGARDWAISRNRYWGAPMPVWVNEANQDDYIVVESIAELKKLAGNDIDVDDLHRPFIDKITFTKDGKTYRRVEEVIDCWFESGSMPVAQQHYPFENVEKFKKSFPADYIGEGLDQTRLWFYVQHVISTILFDRPAYKNVLVNGMIMAADGQKLSKRLKNYPPLDDVFNNEGADSLRLYLLSNNQAVSADYMRFNRDGMKDLNRNVLGTLMNSYRFYKMYADIDNFKPVGRLNSENVLDKWILARLNQTIVEVTKQADDYKLAHAINPVFELVDDLSNWFIRRSRRRFWKSEDDSDKNHAYETLHYVLVKTCQLLAPWAPFISDKVYRDLNGGESVHLSDWPKASEVDQSLLDQMAKTREYINEGLSQRAAAKVKVRQPLQKVAVPKLDDIYKEVIADEVNVKQVEWGKKVELDVKITPELKREGQMREVVRNVQNARKQADLQVDDRIKLSLVTNDEELKKAIEEHSATIAAETLAEEISDKTYKFEAKCKVDGVELEISLEKN